MYANFFFIDEHFTLNNASDYRAIRPLSGLSTIRVLLGLVQ